MAEFDKVDERGLRYRDLGKGCREYEPFLTTSMMVKAKPAAQPAAEKAFWILRS